jgi:hypothetical protein
MIITNRNTEQYRVLYQSGSTYQSGGLNSCFSAIIILVKVKQLEEAARIERG